MKCTIRPALAGDAGAISAVILRALRETNARGLYPAVEIHLADLSLFLDGIRTVGGRSTAANGVWSAAGS
jgi:hypothetical protein